MSGSMTGVAMDVSAKSNAMVTGMDEVMTEAKWADETVGMNKVARRQARQKRLLVEALRSGATVVEACGYAGISRASYYRWKGECEVFEEEARAAVAEVVRGVWEALMAAACGQYVNEVTVREGPRGTVTTQRKRWKGGSVAAMKLVCARLDGVMGDGAAFAEERSALMARVTQLEGMGSSLGKEFLATAQAGLSAMEGVPSVVGDAGDLSSGDDENVERVSQFEAEEGEAVSQFEGEGVSEGEASSQPEAGVGGKVSQSGGVGRGARALRKAKKAKAKMAKASRRRNR